MLTDEILKKLSEGGYVSGEYLASELSVSRNAVWKAVNKLRSEGYVIDSCTNKGYILSDKPDVITKENICGYLKDKKNEYGFIILSEIDSTNRAALDEAAKGAVSGTVVIADTQTKGRGRLGRSFYSPSGSGIYMSVVLRPQIDLKLLPLVTAATGVAVANAVDKVAGVNCKIKWVNDIFLGGRKLCGILSQANIDMETGKAEAVVVGIGINVGLKSYSPELANIAVNLEEYTGKKFERSRIIAEVLNNMCDIEKQIISRSFIKEYRRRSNVIGSEVTVYTANGDYNAFAEDIDSDAKLIVKMPDGTVKKLDSGEVSVRTAKVEKDEK